MIHRLHVFSDQWNCILLCLCPLFDRPLPKTDRYIRIRTMESALGQNQLGDLHDKSLQLSVKARAKDYQDEAETRDSKLKAIWDGEIGNLKNTSISYRNAFVLLLSWHPDDDDLHTGDEVSNYMKDLSCCSSHI
jgi:hypothetical protein